MKPRGLACLAVCWLWVASAAAAEGDVVVDYLQTSALTPQSGAASAKPMQVDFAEVKTEAGVSDRRLLAEGLTLSGTIWAQVDSLPSGSPMSPPASKLDFQSRILELLATYEILPGALILDIGKRVIHPSSGFFKAPLNLMPRPVLDVAASQQGAAVGKWEEGWMGGGITWISDKLTLADFFSPRMAWPDDARSKLQYLTLPQEDFQNLARLGWRVGEADLRLLTLVSKGRLGGPDTPFHLRVGAGVDTNFGESVTVRAEAEAADSQMRPTVVNDSLQVQNVSQAWAPRGLVGFTWANARELSIMAEYYYNGLGFSGHAYKLLMHYQASRLTSPQLPDLLGEYGTFEAARHYAFVRAAGTIDDRLTAEAWIIANLQDWSGLSGALVRLTRDRWSLSGSLMWAWGNNLTEGNLLPMTWRVGLEASLFF
jgi:hypothetical protein